MVELPVDLNFIRTAGKIRQSLNNRWQHHESYQLHNYLYAVLDYDKEHNFSGGTTFE